MLSRILEFADRYGAGFVAYFGVALVSALIEWSTFAVGLTIMSPVPSALMSFVIATTVNFLLSRALVFTPAHPPLKEFFMVMGMSGSVFLWNFAAFYLLYAAAGFQPIIAKVFGTGLGFVFNYGARQFLIFSPISRLARISTIMLSRPRRRQSMAQVAEYTGRRILEAMHSAVLYAETVKKMIEAAKPTGAQTVLEFGAGDGAFIRKFRAQYINIDCVEIDPELRGVLTDLGGRVYSDISEVETASYDFIYTVNVLEHIADLNHAICELRRVLRPGGTLFVFVPAFKVLWTSLDYEVGHVRRFTRRSLMGALKAADFNVARVRYFDSLGFPAALAVRIMEKLGLFSYGGGAVGFYDRYVFPLSRMMDAVFSPILGKNLVAVAHKR